MAVREGEGLGVKKVEGGEEARGVISWGRGMSGGHPAEGGGQPVREQGENAVCRHGEAVGQGEGCTPQVHACGERTCRARLEEERFEGGSVPAGASRRCFRVGMGAAFSGGVRGQGLLV